MKRSDHPVLSEWTIDQAGLCGGTHGNELTGVTAVQRRRLSVPTADTAFLPAATEPTTFTLTSLISNPGAVELCRRYRDFDLNRCFRSQDLARHDHAEYERQRAQVLNSLFGPKGSTDAAYQLLIDLHTTTANLGPTVIIREDDHFARLLAASVQRDQPHVRILSYYAEEDAPEPRTPVGGGPGSANRPGDYPFLAEVTPSGIEVEVGPIPQGVVRADIQIVTERIINSIVTATDSWNRNEPIPVPETITVYRFVGERDFPRDSQGRLLGMIHPDRQDRDFEPVHPGDPLFLHFDGSSITYEGTPGLYPVFINEAAYYEKHAALTLAEELVIPVV